MASVTSIEYRSVIRFLVLKKMDSKTIIEELRSVYGDNAPSRSTIYYWIGEFKNGGRTNVEDDLRSGRPVEIGDNEEEKLIKTVREERRITKDELAVRLNISKGSVFNIMKKCGIRKLCSRFVPYFISREMCDKRMQCCEQNLSLYEELGDTMLQNLITEDETPLSLYLPEDRRSSQEYKFPGESAKRKLRTGTDHRKGFMLVIFWDWQGVVLMDFVECGTRVNSDYYSSKIREARKCRREPYGQSLYLLHDNAPIHTANISTQAVQSTGFVQLPHPPYSPDLAPSDFWLFKHLKQHLKGRRFDTGEDLLECTLDYLSSLPLSFFQEGILILVHR